MKYFDYIFYINIENEIDKMIVSATSEEEAINMVEDVIKNSSLYNLKGKNYLVTVEFYKGEEDEY